jgi:hypothetical protein
VDEFLDEASFLGTNKLVREQLRTVAGCSTLVELLHNSRKSLTVQQVRCRGRHSQGAWGAGGGGRGCLGAA